MRARHAWAGPLATTLGAAVFVLAVLARPPAACAGDEAAQAHLRRAREAMEGGRRGEEREALEQALEEAESAELTHEVAALLGASWVAAGEPYAALQYLERVAGERGRAEDHLAHAEALLAVARGRLSRGETASLQITPYLLDALEAAGHVAGLDPLAARARLVEAEARWWMGELQAAVDLLEAMEAGDLPAVAAARAEELRGQALYALERYPEAAEAFRRAGNARGEASAWAAARRPEETAQAYARLLAAGPATAELLEEALRAARYAGAEALLLEVLATAKADGRAATALLTVRARLLEGLGRVAEARETLERAAAQDPTAAGPLVELGRLAASTGTGEEAADRALEAWAEALRRDPADARAQAFLWDQAGRDYALAWKSPAALSRSLRAQQALAEALGDDGLAWANVGNTLRVAGRQEDALAAYERAVEVEPHEPAIRNDRGLVLQALGRWDEARAAFEAALELDPDHDASRQNLARILWRAGEDAAAARQLARAIQTARATGQGAERYRFLLDRTWRTGRAGVPR